MRLVGAIPAREEGGTGDKGNIAADGLVRFEIRLSNHQPPKTKTTLMTKTPGASCSKA